MYKKLPMGVQFICPCTKLIRGGSIHNLVLLEGGTYSWSPRLFGPKSAYELQLFGHLGAGVKTGHNTPLIFHFYILTFNFTIPYGAILQIFLSSPYFWLHILIRIIFKKSIWTLWILIRGPCGVILWEKPGIIILQRLTIKKMMLTGNLILCTLITGLLYPIVVHWVWDNKVPVSKLNPQKGASEHTESPIRCQWAYWIPKKVPESILNPQKGFHHL